MDAPVSIGQSLMSKHLHRSNEKYNVLRAFISRFRKLLVGKENNAGPRSEAEERVHSWIQALARSEGEQMAQSLASVAGLRGASQAVLEGSLQLNGSSRLPAPAPHHRVAVSRPGLAVRAQQAPAEGEATAQSGRRAVLGLVAAGLAGGSFAQAVLAEAKSIKVGPPPPPSGGLPGTLNSDEPRDLDLPLKERFFLQPLGPAEAAARAKESAKDIIGVKEFIDQKAWPYVMNNLRLKAEYLRYDLNTVISAKPKEEKKPLKELSGKLFATISELDHAAKIKSSSEAAKYYAATKSILDDVIAKLG